MRPGKVTPFGLTGGRRGPGRPGQKRPGLPGLGLSVGYAVAWLSAV